MNARSIAWAGRGLALLATLALLMTSCTMGASPVTSSGSLRAWIDQPISGYTLPMQALTLKAHARQDGGGVTEIHFMVNDTLLANVPADSSQELTSVSTRWNPSAEGWYDIQAIAFNGSGQQASSEVSRICISQSPSGPCPVTAATSGEVDATIKVDASPSPVSIGAECNREDRIVSFEAHVPDTGGAIEVDIHAYLVGASGERWEFFVPLTPGTAADSYVGSYDLGTAYDGVLAGADGTLEYSLVLVNEAKEFFRTSETKILSVRFCGGATPIQGIVKAMGTPELVFKGKCVPSAIDFVAETDIDPAVFDRLDLAYVWFDLADRWIGTTPPDENRAEMTRDAAGAYHHRLDVNTAPAGMNAGGTIKFRAIVVSADNVDVAFSEVSTNVIKPCGAPVLPPQPGITVTAPVPQATCASLNNQYDACKAAGCYYWSNGACADYAEPAAPTCGTYNSKPAQCKNLGCNYWSDGTCSDQAEPYVPPPPPAPTCKDFFNDPAGCKNLGCYYWSDNSCNDYAEPAPPPTCDGYLKPDECSGAGCYWDEKQSLCVP